MADRPWSPAEVELDLRETLEALREAVTEVKQISTDASIAEHEYRKAEAKAYAGLRSTGLSAADAKIRVLTNVEQEHLEFVLSASVVRAAYANIRSLESRCDSLRSLLVSARTVT